MRRRFVLLPQHADDLPQFLHQRGLVVQPPGGVDQQHVRALGAARASARRTPARPRRCWPGRRSPARRCARPRPASCSTAAARNVSPATSTARRPCSRYCCASLPIVVVLPVPLTPTISTTCGFSARFSSNGLATGSRILAISAGERLLHLLVGDFLAEAGAAELRRRCGPPPPCRDRRRPADPPAPAAPRRRACAGRTRHRSNPVIFAVLRDRPCLSRERNPERHQAGSASSPSSLAADDARAQQRARAGRRCGPGQNARCGRSNRSPRAPLPRARPGRRRSRVRSRPPPRVAGPRARGAARPARPACVPPACRGARCTERRAGTGCPLRARTPAFRRTSASVSVGKPAIRSAPMAMPGRSARARGDDRQRVGAQMPPLHALEDQVRPRLQRQMQMRHQPRLLRDQPPQIVVDRGRVERGQPQPRAAPAPAPAAGAPSGRGGGWPGRSGP